MNKKKLLTRNFWYPTGIIFLAIFLITFCFLSNYKLDKDTEKILNYTKKIEVEISKSNWDSALNLYSQLFADWQNVQNTWALLTDHQELDKVSESLIKLKYALLTESNDIRLELDTLNHYLEYIPAKERLNLKNFF